MSKVYELTLKIDQGWYEHFEELIKYAYLDAGPDEVFNVVECKELTVA